MCDDLIHQVLSMIPLFRGEPLDLERQRPLC